MAAKSSLCSDGNRHWLLASGVVHMEGLEQKVHW
jgi:hypothetical protein